ncbi:MAG: MBL fold metallo-hydrolase [Thermocrispum agreste]|uniref:MBL fold metallo-hydrolase n=1 Tax=Thermocrispum agreste TaxID=37925 RepID=A0ABD6FJT0_9PSEU
MGALPDPEEMARRARNSVYRNGAFHNLGRTTVVPPAEDVRSTLREMWRNRGSRKPAVPVPLTPAQPPAPGGLHVTWYGHASSLVEISGVRLLLDPVWGPRVSPVPIGPRRLHPVPHRLADVGRVDAVLVSHDHYDHLDMPTVDWLRDNTDAPFVVPLGVGAHLRFWQVPAERIVELDWTESADVAGVRLTATPAWHFSGRGLRRNPTLWASWVIAGADARVFYSGDSGYFDGYAAIGAEHGPFDASLIQVGAYAASWPDVHMTPEEGVRAHRDLRGGLLIPVHWGTFTLAPHPWAEPAERAVAAAEAAGVPIAVPNPGQRIDVATPPPPAPWWKAHVASA